MSFKPNQMRTGRAQDESRRGAIHGARFARYESRFTPHLLRRQTERMRQKLERRGQVLGEILPIMSAGVKVKLMRYPARGQQLVELLVALVEPKIIIW